MQIAVVSLFPEMVGQVAEFGVVGRAKERELLNLHCENPRDYATDVHRTVDDRPYGGGPGMVLKYEPTAKAIHAAKEALPAGCPVVCLSPQGQVFDQAAAQRYAGLPGMILLAGRYEGIDERLIDREVDEELSLGDFVLSGGEIAAMAVIDAVARLLPGVLGDEESALQDSFMQGLLDYPHYTRPAVMDDKAVPEVLLSGHHARIEQYNRQMSLQQTAKHRPELLGKTVLSKDDIGFITQK